MRDFVCSCAAGAIGNTPILDLNYVEDSGGSADLPVAVLPNINKVCLFVGRRGLFCFVCFFPLLILIVSKLCVCLYSNFLSLQSFNRS